MTSKHQCHLDSAIKMGTYSSLNSSHTFPDKEAHKRIIYEYILKLEITESNNMEGFQRELRRHIKQYDAIQGSEWKKITNHIIRQYHKIDSPLFNMGFNMLVIMGPAKTKKNTSGHALYLNGPTPHTTLSSPAISGPNQKQPPVKS
jgi:hypothetical protein